MLTDTPLAVGIIDDDRAHAKVWLLSANIVASSLLPGLA
jgi:hypothetical protein